MQSRNKDFIIAGLIAAGIVVLYIFPGASTFIINTAKVSILVGGAMFLVRMHRTISAFLYAPPSQETKQGEIEMRLLIQTMGIIARADGVIEHNEIETIREIHARMFGINLEKNEVDEILAKLGSPIEVLADLGQNKSSISPLMKEKIIQACHLVTISDLNIDDKEQAQIGAIGMALGYSQNEIGEIVALAEI